MKTPNVNDVIPELGQLVADLVADHEGWETAFAEAEAMTKTMWQFQVWSESGGDEIGVSLFGSEMGDTLSELFRGMWTRFDKAGSPWKKAIFTLTSDGDAEVDFEYDD